MMDYRKRKIEAAANLTSAIFIKSKVSYDEKELLVNTLEDLDPIHLTVIEQIIKEINTNGLPQKTWFNWENIQTHFIDAGLKPMVITKVLSTLESVGFINAFVITGDKATHAVTDFGLEFFSFITQDPTKNPYIKNYLRIK